jgi:hypothetical protein
MTAIFSFDEADDHFHPRTRRDTASSINSFDDRWAHNTEHENDISGIDILPRTRQFNSPWDTAIAEEEESPLRTGTPPIRIPNGSSHSSGRNAAPRYGSSLQVAFDEEFIAAQVRLEGSLNKKMSSADFDQIRVLGKGGYRLLCVGC